MSRIRFQAVTPQAVAYATETLRSIDGIVLPHGFLSDVPAVDLFQDSWVCIVSADNTRVGNDLTMADLAELPWIVGYDGPIAFTPVVRHLRMLGIEPNVYIVAETFLAIPFLVAGTERVALVQARLADRLATAARVRPLPCPGKPSRSARPSGGTPRSVPIRPTCDSAPPWSPRDE
jgi:DNA-binding transcriptional LysR family regulator